MDPQSVLLVADDRAEELTETSAACRRAAKRRARRARRMRERAGWVLVTAGLHLAVSAERPLRS